MNHPGDSVGTIIATVHPDATVAGSESASFPFPARIRAIEDMDLGPKTCFDWCWFSRHVSIIEANTVGVNYNDIQQS